MKQNPMPAASSLLAVLVSRKLSSNDLRQLRKNIETMEEVIASTPENKSLRKDMNKKFQKAHSEFFRNCDFLDEKQAITFGELKNRLLAKEKNDLSVASPSVKKTTSAADHQTLIFDESMDEYVTPEEAIEMLRVTFISSLEASPGNAPDQTGADKSSPSANKDKDAPTPGALLTPSPAAEKFKSQLVRFGNRLPNIAGGDCLLHALAGKNLPLDQIIPLRKRIAEIKRQDTNENPGLNAMQLLEGMFQSPSFREEALSMMAAGKDSISNNVYANFQAIPGTYAGWDELAQWTALMGNRKKKVLVVDDTEGDLAMFSNGKRHSLKDEELEQAMKTATIVLYKSGPHWEQLVRHPEWQPSKTTVTFNEDASKNALDEMAG